MTKNEFLPDWASPPGATINDLLTEREQSFTSFAEALSCSHEYALGLMDGSSEITPDIARQLEKVLGVTAKFWLRREAQFRAGLIRLSQKTTLNQQEHHCGN